MHVAPPAMQLSYDQETIDAGLIDNSNLQPLVLPLDTSMKYALGRGGRSGAPEGCVLLTVNDPKVSSCHFLLEFVWSGSATGCWMLTDGNGTKRSTNGVLVDQQRVPAEPVALRPGSRISVKNSKVALHLALTPEAQAKADAAAAAAAAAEAGAEAAAEPVAASSEAAPESKVKAQVKTEAEPEPEPEPEEPRAPGGPAARQLLVYSQRPSGEAGFVTQPLGFVKISFGDKLPALHRKIMKEGLGAHFAQAGFQFLMPMGEAQVPLWEPQYKDYRVRDILHKPRENAGGISDCVTVRAIPPRVGASPTEEQAGEVSAPPAQQGALNGGPAGSADGGAAAGGAAEAVGGAAAAAVGGAPSRKKAAPRAVFVNDPADPKPRTAYAIFTEERTRELQQEREQAEQPPLSKKEAQQQVCAEWKNPWFRQERKRELDEQQKRLKGDWSKRRKLAEPSPVPVGYTTPVCNAAEVDQGHGLEPGAGAAEVLLSPGEVPKYPNVAELHTGGFHVEEMD